MGKVSAKKRTEYLGEIAQLKAKRRGDIIKCAGALVAILFFLLIKQVLVMQGIVDQANIVVASVTMLAALGLAIFAGSASTDFAKSGRRIDTLCAEGNLSKEDTKNA
ncbi:MAG: hypothetical protein RR655_01445 [Raoultibacter sp.]